MPAKIKNLLKRFVPLPAKQTLEQNRQIMKELESIKKMLKVHTKKAVENRFCPACGMGASMFAPFGITIKRPNAQCLSCRSLERHRTLLLYLDRKTNIFSTDQPLKLVCLLHFAPEPVFFDKFSKLQHIEYYPVDFDTNRYKGLRDIVDIQCIPYGNDIFDIIICSHILEHVPDDHKAMTELHRVLKSDGTAYISIPDYNAPEKTYEDSSHNTPELRLEHYGQKDHLRIYGKDFSLKLESAGFNVEILEPNKFMPESELLRYGLIREERIYKCMKG